ncbi:hypothetical protein KP509_03G027400 [Ceratopteris richardii]|nr:hypothetical protein KP509_03G027400 [Ceratopteris richardii]
MACCIVDYSHQLLIEPRLKKVICLVDAPLFYNLTDQNLFHQIISSVEPSPCSHCSSKQTAVFQLDGEKTTDSMLEDYLVPDIISYVGWNGFADEPRADDADEASICVKKQMLCTVRSGLQSEENDEDRKQDASLCRPSASDDLEDRIVEIKSNLSPFSRDILHTSNEVAESENANMHRASSSEVSFTDGFDVASINDAFEWSKRNLPSRGTVATLMFSEMRSSRREEADQVLLSALACQNADFLREKWKTHGDFASKWIVKKVMEALKKKARVKEQKLDHKCMRDKGLYSDARRRSLAGIQLSMKNTGPLRWLGMWCHRSFSKDDDDATYSTSLSANPFPGSQLNSRYPIHVTSNHLGSMCDKDSMIEAESVASCLPDPTSSSASMVETLTCHDSVNKDTVANYQKDYGDARQRCHHNVQEKHFNSSNNKHRTRDLRTLFMQDFSGELNDSIAYMVRQAKGESESRRRQQTSIVREMEGTHRENIVSRDSTSTNSCEVTSYNQNVTGAPAHDESDDKYAESFYSKSRIGPLHDNLMPHMSSGQKVMHEISSQEISRRIGEIDKSKNEEQYELGEYCSHVRTLEDTVSLQEADIAFIRTSPFDSLLTLQEAENSASTVARDNPALNRLMAQMDHSIIDEDLSKAQQIGFLNLESPHAIPIDPKGSEGAANPLLCAEDEHSIVEYKHGQRRDGRRKARVPLRSLFAENNVSMSASSGMGTSEDSLDTWEEPTEALEPLCCVCMIGLRGAAFTPCGHTFCRKCSRELWKGRGSCPLCNKLITGILDIF